MTTTTSSSSSSRRPSMPPRKPHRAARALPAHRAHRGSPGRDRRPERHTHLWYLAESCRRVDDRTDAPRARIHDAKFPRLRLRSSHRRRPRVAPALLANCRRSLHDAVTRRPARSLRTGKSHLSRTGLRPANKPPCPFITTAQLVNELVEAADERVLSRVVPATGACTFLPHELAMSKSTLAERNCCSRSSPNVNGLPSDRDQLALQRMAPSSPPPPVAAIVDRVTFNAHIINPPSPTTTTTKPPPTKHQLNIQNRTALAKSCNSPAPAAARSLGGSPSSRRSRSPTALPSNARTGTPWSPPWNRRCGCATTSREHCPKWPSSSTAAAAA